MLKLTFCYTTHKLINTDYIFQVGVYLTSSLHQGHDIAVCFSSGNTVID